MLLLLLSRGEKKNLLLFGLLGEEDSLDVGKDTTLSDGDSREKLVQLLVITDGKLQMSWDDSGLLVVTGSIASQLEDLSSEVLKDGSQVDRSTSPHSLGIVSFAKESVDPAHRELKPGTAGSALCLSLCLTAFATSRHDLCLVLCYGNKRIRVSSQSLHFGRKFHFISAHRIHGGEKFGTFGMETSDWLLSTNEKSPFQMCKIFGHRGSDSLI